MTTEIDKRLRRARNQQFEIETAPAGDSLLDDPPITLHSTSGERYTVIPEHAHCGCPDAEHRSVPCKHLLALALDTIEDGLPRERRERLAEAIRAERDRLDSEIEDLSQRLDEVRSRRDTWDDAVDHLGSHNATQSRDSIDAIASTVSVNE